MTRLLSAALLALLLAAASPAASAPLPDTETPTPAWVETLRTRLDAAEARFPGEIGVYVHHLGRDETFSFRADENWYLASGVKVPVAIAVLRRIEDGALALDSRIALEPDDFVDGAGGTNAHPPGTRLRVSYLLEQMIIYSDNTATDVLIRVVGLDEVNAVARELVAAQGLEITTLADVRRRAYGTLHPGAAGLTSADLLALRRAAAGAPRLDLLAQMLGTTPGEFLLPDLDSAFEAYYAINLNSAPLSAYGRMLGALADGRALGPEQTAYLLGVMERVRTGDRRIRAALPPGARFAHKTGTQHRRVCDLGIVTLRGERVVIAACARGGTTAQGERALRDVGAAVTASGVLSPLR
ncbi:serine hydrolase [Coralloluteibacterium thermophilus]|uniref:beta-lactamase n=1 Tax=Coralloluteibacterium thermophilum TaxID=2707049 RepID=A0ABV9NF38_9GAMM